MARVILYRNNGWMLVNDLKTMYMNAWHISGSGDHEVHENAYAFSLYVVRDPDVPDDERDPVAGAPEDWGALSTVEYGIKSGSHSPHEVTDARIQCEYYHHDDMEWIIRVQIKNGDAVWKDADPYDVQIRKCAFMNDEEVAIWGPTSPVSNWFQISRGLQPAVVFSSSPRVGSELHNRDGVVLSVTTRTDAWLFEDEDGTHIADVSIIFGDNDEQLFDVSGPEISDNGRTLYYVLTPNVTIIDAVVSFRLVVNSMFYLSSQTELVNPISSGQFYFNYGHEVGSNEYVPVIPETPGSTDEQGEPTYSYDNGPLPHHSVMEDLDVLYDYLKHNLLAIEGISSATLAATVASAVVAALNSTSGGGNVAFKPTVYIG